MKILPTIKILPKILQSFQIFSSFQPKKSLQSFKNFNKKNSFNFGPTIFLPSPREFFPNFLSLLPQQGLPPNRACNPSKQGLPPHGNKRPKINLNASIIDDGFSSYGITVPQPSS